MSDVSRAERDVPTASGPYSTCELAGTLVVQLMVALERVTLLESIVVNSGGTAVGVTDGVGLAVGLTVWVAVGVLVDVPVGVMVAVVVRVGVLVICWARLTCRGSVRALAMTSATRAHTSASRTITGRSECHCLAGMSSGVACSLFGWTSVRVEIVAFPPYRAGLGSGLIQLD